jgi:hypothetical protein
VKISGEIETDKSDAIFCNKEEILARKGHTKAD